MVNCQSGSVAAVEVVQKIEAAGGRALAILADVAKKAHVRDLFRIAVDTFGTLNILVSAGLHRDAPLTDITLDQWNTVLSVNLTGQFLSDREVARQFMCRTVDSRVSVSGVNSSTVSIASGTDLILSQQPGHQA